MRLMAVVGWMVSSRPGRWVFMRAGRRVHAARRITRRVRSKSRTGAPSRSTTVPLLDPGRRLSEPMAPRHGLCQFEVAAAAASKITLVFLRCKADALSIDFPGTRRCHYLISSARPPAPTLIHHHSSTLPTASHNNHPQHINYHQPQPLQWPAPSRQPVSNTLSWLACAPHRLRRRRSLLWCSHSFSLSPPARYTATSQHCIIASAHQIVHRNTSLTIHRQVHGWQGPS